MKQLLKKIIPKSFFLFYHYIIARIASFIYGNPSKDMFVVGVTGTNGKTTTSNLIVDFLEEAGHKAGCTTTTNFRIGNDDKLNDTKQTMLGRFKLQKFLKQMRAEKCTYAVIETSSEGIAQFRHRGIDYNAAIFMNLTPEHIESHGSFEAYRQAKENLFEKVAADHPVHGVGVYNLDDKNVSAFLKYNIPKKYGFTFDKNIATRADRKLQLKDARLKILRVIDVHVGADGSRFTIHFKGQTFEFVTKLRGRFNIENILAALCLALSQGVSLGIAQRVLRKKTHVPGRVEFIHEGQDFDVVVDYAPEPESLRQIYQFLKLYKKEHNVRRMIHVTGSAGGGRDKSRRPILGNIAATNSDIVIVTNEDPYDEDPQAIIDQVAQGALNNGKKLDKNLFKVSDRRKAIKLAISKAKSHDLVLLTGKGSEQAIVTKNNKKIPWDERDVVRKIIQEISISRKSQTKHS